MIEMRVRGVREFRRKIAEMNRQLDGQTDMTAMKIANQTAGAIRRSMTMSGIKQRSGILWQSFAPRRTAKGNWIISPIGTEPSGLPTGFLATILEEGRLIHGWHFSPRPGIGRHGEGYMKVGGYHYTRPKRFIEAGIHEGRARAVGIANNDMSKLIRRVFR